METGLKDAAHENYESARDYLICTPSLALNLYKKYQIVYASVVLTVTDVVKLTLKMTAAQVVETSVISELTQRDGRGKKTANLVWQAWQ